MTRRVREKYEKEIKIKIATLFSPNQNEMKSNRFLDDSLYNL